MSKEGEIEEHKERKNKDETQGSSVVWKKTESQNYNKG